jgi:uncharacterized protein YdcH (DUF465 family)
LNQNVWGSIASLVGSEIHFGRDILHVQDGIDASFRKFYDELNKLRDMISENHEEME